MPYPPSWDFMKHCFWSRNLVHKKIQYGNGPRSWNSPVLPPIPHHQLSWQNSKIAFEDPAGVPARWQYLVGPRNALGQYLIWGAVSHTARIHRSNEERIKVRVAPLLPQMIQQQHFWLPFPMTLESTWSRGLHSKGRNAFIRIYNNDSTKLKGDTATWPLCAPMPLN